jgi:hypothetical protein
MGPIRNQLVPCQKKVLATVVTLLFLVDIHVVVKPRNAPITY